MAEAAASIVAEQLAAPAATWIERQINYVLHFKINVEKFTDQLNNLRHRRERIDDATEVIEGDVEDWLQRVKTSEENAELFLEETERAKKGCFFGLCPNVKARYQVSKKAEKVSKAAADLLLPGECPRVLCRPLPKGIPFAPVKDYETFKSRTRHFKEIMEALKNPNVSMIGVWGMGGVGKTTLVKKAAEQANVDRVFDVVIFSEVSLNQDLGRIQGEIADALGLKFNAETISGRSNELRERFRLRLQKEKKILVILDNIWAVNNKLASLDLGDLGIPFGDDRKGCKILMTSRDVEVLTRMDTNSLNIRVDALDDGEAWNLFEKMAGDVVKARNKQPLAVKITKRCGGLPILITAVAMALRNKDDSRIWKAALYQLEHEFDEPVRSALELSYDHLESEEIKQLFLLCGQLINTDYAIEDLLNYCMSLDSFKDIDCLEDRRNKLHKLVGDLKSKCLLLDGEENGYVKMHDVVRMFAVSYARQKHNMFMEEYDGELEEWPRRNTNVNFSSICFPHNHIHRLLERLECPELKLFILHSKNRNLKIPCSFFQRVGGVIVLDIKNIVLPSLPSSFRCLQNLRTLSLEKCELEDTTMIGELVGLEVLRLVNTDISSLPEEIRQLTSLKLLCVSGCINLKEIPRNVISSLTQLEELSMERSFVNWEVEGDNCQNACLAELKKLSKLTSLDIHISSSNIMPNDLFSVMRLKKFKILIGDGWDWSWSSRYETSRRLKLKLSSDIHLKPDVKELLKKTEDLYLDELGAIHSVCMLDREGSFPRLRCLHVQRGPNFQYIVNSNTRVPHQIFPDLEVLSLEELANLEMICRSQLGKESFSKLRTVKVKRCNMLKNLFSLTIAKSQLLQLKEIAVENCENMEEIFSCEREEDDKIVIELKEVHSLRLEFLPKITSLCSEAKLQTGDSSGSSQDVQLIPLLNGKILFPNLENLVLFSIGAEKIWGNSLLAMPHCFEALRDLKVRGCNKLMFLFPVGVVTSLIQLKELRVEDCELMEGIIEGVASHMIFHKLCRLDLDGLPKLKRFCTGSYIKFPSLSYMRINKCPELKSFIFDEKEISNDYLPPPLFDEKVELPTIESLIIRNMVNLKRIWHNELVPESFCKLDFLSLGDCQKLSNIFPSNMLIRLQNLRELWIGNCMSMDVILDLEGPNALEMHITKLKSIRIFFCPSLKIFASQCRNVQEGANGEYLFLHEKIVLPSLENLDLSSIGTEKIWDNSLLAMSHCFETLRDLKVEGCNKLKFLFPVGVVTSLIQLKVLRVINCKLMEGIIEGVAGATIFPKLRRLNLNGLPKLKRFCTGNSIEFPSLSNMWIDKCPELKSFIFDEKEVRNDDLPPPLFDEKVELPTIERLTITSVNLKRIWHKGLAPESFSKLDDLHLYDCENLLYVFSSNMLARLQNCRGLEIQYCKSMDVIFDLEGPNALEMHITKDPIFRKLKSITIDGCPSLRYIFPLSIGTGLQELEKLHIQNCRVVEKIVATEGVVDADVRLEFPKVTWLRLEGLPKLRSFYPGIHTSKWPLLKTLSVTRCEELKIFTSECLNVQAGANGEYLYSHEKEIFPNMKKLSLGSNYPMNELWHGEFLFKKLPNLEELHVSSSGFEEIFPNGGLIGEAGELSTSCTLKTLTVVGCDRLKFLFPSSLLSFCNLITLDVSRCDGLTYLMSSSTAKSMMQLQHLSVCGCEMMVSIVECVGEGEAEDDIIFPQLKKLDISNMPKLSSFYRSGKLAFELPSLERITVGRCRNLKTFCEGPLSSFKLQSVIGEAGESSTFCSLKTLSVLRCDRLKILFPSSLLSFCSLISLHVYYCPRLTYLMSSSTANSMMHLQELKVRECFSMTSIVECVGEGEAEDDIIFPQLKKLVIYDMRKLSSFCDSEKLAFKLPSLEKVTVQRCPKLKTFCEGPLSAFKLRSLNVSYSDERVRWNGDQNTIIQNMYKERVFKKRLHFRMAIKIQCQFRRHVARRDFIALRMASIVIQSAVRGNNARNFFESLKGSIALN